MKIFEQMKLFEGHTDYNKYIKSLNDLSNNHYLIYIKSLMNPKYEDCFKDIEYTTRILDEDIYNFKIEIFDEVVTEEVIGEYWLEMEGIEEVIEEFKCYNGNDKLGRTLLESENYEFIFLDSESFAWRKF